MLLTENQQPTYRSSNASQRWLRLFVVILGLLVIWSLQIESPTVQKYGRASRSFAFARDGVCGVRRAAAVSVKPVPTFEQGTF